MLDVEFIKSRRAELQLSQAKAAKRAGMSPAKWSQFECGRITDPQLSTAARIARALRCPVGKLIRRKAQAPLESML